jgi:hypothetical protein
MLPDFVLNLIFIVVRQVVRFLSIDELAARAEDDVCKAALRWLNHRPTERQCHIVKLFASVRMEYVDVDFLRHRILASDVSTYSTWDAFVSHIDRIERSSFNLQHLVHRSALQNPTLLE